MDFSTVIRTIPDYPKPGIMFRDITTLLGNPRAFRSAVDALVQPYAGVRIDKVAGIEARGFILGGAVAHQLSAPRLRASAQEGQAALIPCWARTTIWNTARTSSRSMPMR